MSRVNLVLRLDRFGSSLRACTRVVREPVAQPGPGEVLIRHHYLGVNGLFDEVVARGELPYRHVAPPCDLGVEAVGRVVEVGAGVTALRPGDPVATSRFGTGYREWLVIDAAEALPVPAATPEYVALRTSAVSALLALESAGSLGRGEVVLVTAAAGGLGQFLVQLARLAGNHVIGVCSGPAKVGVTVWGHRGDEEVDAAAVVLATGGFAADPAVFAEIEGVPLVSAAHPTSTGDGLLLAQTVGAAVAGRGTYLPTFGGLPHPTTPTRAQWSDRPLLVTSQRPPWEVYVDRDGRRFVAEDEPSIDQKERALARIPDMTFWTVFDALAHRESTPMVLGWSPADLAARAGRRAGVHRADDLASLARVAGIDPVGLLATVDVYNAALTAGRPDPFGRRHRPAPIAEPPFFALENHGVTLISFAGVDVDAELAVRRADGSAVPGLFAVGEVLGAGATCGNSFCGGMMVTPALALGRWLGARLAAAL